MSLHSLPPEIIHSILDHTSTPEPLSLCLTDKRTSQLVQPRLFKHFYFRDPTKAVKSCLALKSRPDLALSVRCLELLLDTESAILPDFFWESFLQASFFMSNIVTLHFSLNTTFDVIFRNVTFPQLKCFSTVKYFTPEVGKFLSRHSTVTELYLGCDNTPDITPDFLPLLRCLSCTLFMAEKIVPGRPIIELSVTRTSSPSEERTTDIIKIISLSSIPILRFTYTSYYFRENRIPLVMAIAQYLPDLQTLCLNSNSWMDTWDIESLNPLLPTFKSLRRLLIPLIDRPVDPSDASRPSTIYRESKFLAEWKKICPELLYIMFPGANVYMYDTSQMVWTQTGYMPSESTTLLPDRFLIYYQDVP